MNKNVFVGLVLLLMLPVCAYSSGGPSIDDISDLVGRLWFTVTVVVAIPMLAIANSYKPRNVTKMMVGALVIPPGLFGLLGLVLAFMIHFSGNMGWVIGLGFFSICLVFVSVIIYIKQCSNIYDPK